MWPTGSRSKPDVALVDEADSVLIDEARVPLVLAGATRTEELDEDVVQLVRTLRAGVDYEIDGDGRTVALTDKGTDKVEETLGGINLYEDDNLDRLTQINVALHAEVLLRKDVDYLVRDGKVSLINNNRGRIAKLQRWPDGLQAAVEAKEAVPVSDSGEVLDSITVQALVNGLQDAVRHDRYGGRRRGVAAGVLRGRGGRRTAEQAEHPRSTTRTGCT